MNVAKKTRKIRRREGLLYLAQPYAHADPDVREFRCAAGTAALAWLVRNDIPAFAPIPHGHAAGLLEETLAGANARENPRRKHEYWMTVSRAILKNACAGLAVIAMPGWEESAGVAEEIAIAKKMGMPCKIVPFKPPPAPGGLEFPDAAARQALTEIAKHVKKTRQAP